MDLWGFKKWRRQLGYTQTVAGEKLGLSRGAIQIWESESRPVPRAVELACQELLRLSKQQPDFGPVTLLYSDAPIGHDASIVLQSERHPNNESALRSAAELRRRRYCAVHLSKRSIGSAHCVGNGTCQAASRRREPVTGRQTVPNSLLEAHMTRFQDDGAGPCQPNTFLQFRSPCQFLRCRRRPTPARQFPTSGIGQVRPGRAHTWPVALKVQYMPGGNPRHSNPSSRGKCGTTSVPRHLNDSQLRPMMRTARSARAASARIH